MLASTVIKTNPTTGDTRRTLEELAALPGVTPLTAPAGQVLVYRGHYPNGLFVVVAGAVELDGGDFHAPCLLRAEPVPFAFPPPDELDLPAALCATTVSTSRLLFVPRCLATAPGAPGSLLGGGAIAVHSLQTLHETPHPTRPA